MTALTGYKTDRVGSYIKKDPVSDIDYSINWNDWLDSGDDISASVWAVSTIVGDPSPMTLHTQSFSASTNIAVTFAAAGTAGNKYTITNTMTSVNGEIVKRYFRIFVEDRSA